jgi:hypothetical protein
MRSEARERKLGLGEFNRMWEGWARKERASRVRAELSWKGSQLEVAVLQGSACIAQAFFRTKAEARSWVEANYGKRALAKEAR